MPLFGRRNSAEPVSIQTEHERLRAIRMAAEQELARLRRELTERVAIVEQRERELADAVARVNRTLPRHMLAADGAALEHARVGLAAHAQELNRRLRELESRELNLMQREQEFARRLATAAQTPEERLAHIEKRLADLYEAEKVFARTQAELATRSEELASREAALEELERASGAALTSRAELVEIDERLRRLERETREAAGPPGFGDTLRSLEQRGFRGASPSA